MDRSRIKQRGIKLGVGSFIYQFLKFVLTWNLNLEVLADESSLFVKTNSQDKLISIRLDRREHQGGGSPEVTCGPKQDPISTLSRLDRKVGSKEGNKKERTGFIRQDLSLPPR